MSPQRKSYCNLSIWYQYQMETWKCFCSKTWTGYFIPFTSSYSRKALELKQFLSKIRIWASTIAIIFYAKPQTNFCFNTTLRSTHSKIADV